MNRVRGLLVPAIALLLAEAGFRLAGIESDTLAAPTRIAAGAVEVVADGSLLKGTFETLGAMLGGLGLGALFGVACGMALGFSHLADRYSFLTIEMLRPIPSVALLPLSLLVFGFGFRMEIAVIAFATFWPMLLLTRTAVGQIEPRLIEVSQVMNMRLLAFALKIVLPAAAPRMMTALRLAAGLALVVAITAEIVVNPQGLGHDLMIAQETLRPQHMFAFMLWIGILGWGENAALLGLERYLFSHRGDVDTSIAA